MKQKNNKLKQCSCVPHDKNIKNVSINDLKTCNFLNKSNSFTFRVSIIISENNEITSL